MNRIIDPNAPPDPHADLKFLIRNEIAGYHNSYMGPLSARVNELEGRVAALEFQRDTVNLCLDAMLSLSKPKAIKAIESINTQRTEHWRILCLPAEPMCMDDDGNPRALAAVDQREDECEVHVISEDEAVAEIVNGKRYVGKDKGEALRLLAKDLDDA